MFEKESQRLSANFVEFRRKEVIRDVSNKRTPKDEGSSWLRLGLLLRV